MWGRRQTYPDQICVSSSIRDRARKALGIGAPSIWIDQTLYLIGHNTTHHRPGDPLLDEAITSAETLLALLVELRRQEQS